MNGSETPFTKQFCAGVYGPDLASADTASADFDNVFSVNARGVWLCAREETRQMKTQEALPSHDGRQGSRGAIVNVGSSLGISPIPTKSKSQWKYNAVLSRG